MGLLTGLIFSSTGCTKGFIDMNNNPNEVTTVQPTSIFPTSIINLVNNNLERSFRINLELAQVTVTSSDSREIHRYEIRNSESNSSWQNWYIALTNIRDVYKTAEESQVEGYQTWQGISLIMDAYVGSLLTDVYGDVPYSEANKGREFEISPKFDKQQFVYQQLFEKLEKANELLKLNIDLPANQRSAEPFYGRRSATINVAEKWRKFGNSLYLRLLLRTSGKSELNSVAKIKEIVETNTSNYPIFQNNNDNAVFGFTTNVPFQTAFFNYRDNDFNGDKGYTDFFINTLQDLNDPRIEKWATEATLGVYSGVQSGYKKGNAPELGSRLQLTLKNDERIGNIMNYSELQFILAEAAAKGFISGDVNTYYNNGIKSSFEFWETTLPETYLTSDIVKIENNADLATKMEKIHTQRYYSMLFTDFQQWTEIRRTGHPELPIGPGVGNEGKYPARLPYPASTISYNKANYLEAVASMGADDINAKVWWNK